MSSQGSRLQTFLKQSFESKIKLEYFHGDTVFIFDPLLKVPFLSAAAAIEIKDLVNQRDMDFLKLAFMLVILTGMIYLLVAWVSKTMIEPTAFLADVFSEISVGNYSKSFFYVWKNELGVLAKATNVMTKGLRQREILGKFVSATFDKNVMAESNEQLAQQIHGTILFSDIRSFTTMAETQPPEAISLLLNHHLQEMGKEIQKFHGQIEQFIG
jgi:methyl-accepting chemotaxis protein